MRVSIIFRTGKKKQIRLKFQSLRHRFSLRWQFILNRERENGERAANETEQKKKYHDERSNTKKVNLIRLWLRNGFFVCSNYQFFVISLVFYLMHHELPAHRHSKVYGTHNRRYEFNYTIHINRISDLLPFFITFTSYGSLCYILSEFIANSWYFFLIYNNLKC